jgi:excisionase family DNA binding protein
MNNQKVVKIKEVAEYLSVSPKTVYQWAELRKIPAYKINGCLRFDLEEVMEYIKTCKIKPQSRIIGSKTLNRKSVMQEVE